MPSREELRLARAKAMFSVAAESAHRPPRWESAHISVRKLWLDIARAIESTDTALGVVSVPVEATEEMVVHATEQWLCIAAMEDRAEVIWNAMLAASPLREKTDE